MSPRQLAFVVRGRLEGDGQGRSGGYLYDRELVRGLRARGHRVDVLDSLRLQSEGGRTLAQAEVILEDELCHPEIVELQGRGQWPSTPLRVAVVHNLLANVPSCPLATAEREAAYLRGVDAWVCNSRHTLDRVMAHTGRYERPHCIAYPYLGPEIAEYWAAGGPEPRAPGRSADLRLLSVGHLSALKGLRPLIRAMAGGPRALSLELVGGLDRDPEYVALLRADIERLGLSGRVRCTGELTGQALVERFLAADLMVLPSREEGFGIAYLEAMAMALPVVASRLGAAPELITDGVEGFLFDPDSLESLTVTLARVEASNRDGRLAEMGAAAQVRCRRAPDWSDMVDNVDALIGGGLGGRVRDRSSC